jgi:hypothetical protein
VRLWRAGQLAAELRDGRLTETQKFHYVLAAAGLHYIVGPLSLLSGPKDTRTLVLLGLAATLATLGLVWCFQANQRGDGRLFLERYLCLAVPTTVRTYVIGYGLYYSLAAAAYRLLGESSLQWFRDPWGVPVVFGAVLLVAYFATLRYYVAQASSTATA